MPRPSALSIHTLQNPGQQNAEVSGCPVENQTFEAGSGPKVDNFGLQQELVSLQDAPNKLPLPVI